MKPLFLDRDGVLNVDRSPCIASAAEIILTEGAGEGLALLQRAGYAFYVVSNQQAVSKGLFPAEELPRMSARLQELLAPYGVRIAAFRYALALKEENHPWRKPNPGMILDLCRAHGLDPRGAYMVGDRESDLAAGVAAGCRPLLVLTGQARLGDVEGYATEPEAVLPTLREVAAYILAHEAEGVQVQSP